MLDASNITDPSGGPAPMPDPLAAFGGGGGFDPTSLLGLIPGILAGINSGGNLTSLLGGIPPEEVNLLKGEGGLVGSEQTMMNQRNNIIQQLFPQFLSQISNIDPSVINQFLSQGQGFANAGAGDISAASDFINKGGDYTSQATPYANHAQDFISMIGPVAQALEQFISQRMNLGSPYYAQHQLESFNAGSQNFNNLESQMMDKLGQQGMGFGPSGVNASALADVTRSAGQTMAEQYLANLFQNENMQMEAAKMQPSVSNMYGQQAGLETNLAQIPLAQASREATLAGEKIGQGNAMTGLTNATKDLGSLALGGQNLQATKAGLLDPKGFFGNPSFPNFPVNLGALPNLSSMLGAAGNIFNGGGMTTPPFNPNSFLSGKGAPNIPGFSGLNIGDLGINTGDPGTFGFPGATYDPNYNPGDTQPGQGGWMNANGLPPALSDGSNNDPFSGGTLPPDLVPGGGGGWNDPLAGMSNSDL